MKTIDTLIEDIHTLLETGINTSTVQNRDKIRDFAMEISSSVARQLGEENVKR